MRRGKSRKGWIVTAGADPAKDGPSQRGGSRKGRVAAAGQIIQRAGSARSGVSVRIHFATRFACDDDTVCVTECAPFLVGSNVVGLIVCGVLGAHEREASWLRKR